MGYIIKPLRKVRLLIVIIFLILQLSSCQQNNKTKPKVESTEKSITDNFFKEFTKIYEDNGLLQTGNVSLKRGSFEIYLTSKNGAKQWLNDLNEKGNYDDVIKKLNNSSPNEIAKNFDIWVFYTDKKYIIELEDESLGNKVPGIVELYYLKAETSKWEKKDEYQIKNEEDQIKLNDWKQQKIESILNLSNNKTNPNKNISSKLSEKWIGSYDAHFSYGQIGGENAGWDLKLEISNDSIKATGEGYQISFSDLLNAKENNNELVLSHYKNLSGYSLGEKMSPEIILILDNGKYFINTKWIDNDIITKSKKLGYEIEKQR